MHSSINPVLSRIHGVAAVAEQACHSKERAVHKSFAGRSETPDSHSAAAVSTRRTGARVGL